MGKALVQNCQVFDFAPYNAISAGEAEGSVQIDCSPCRPCRTILANRPCNAVDHQTGRFHVQKRGYLRLSFESLLFEHAESVVVDVRATTVTVLVNLEPFDQSTVCSPLNTLVHPRTTVPLLIDRDTEGLTTAIVLSIDERDIISLGVLRELLGTGHSCRSGSNNEDPFPGLLGPG